MVEFTKKSVFYAAVIIGALYIVNLFVLIFADCWSHNAAPRNSISLLRVAHHSGNESDGS